MTYLPRDEHMSDPNFCRGKEAEYSAKAKAATSPGVKSAFEATVASFRSDQVARPPDAFRAIARLCHAKKTP